MITDIVGKRIAGVIVKGEHPGGFGRTQVFLLFENNTYYEIYGEFLKGASSIQKGGPDDVRGYCSDVMTVWYERLLPALRKPKRPPARSAKPKPDPSARKQAGKPSGPPASGKTKGKSIERLRRPPHRPRPS